MILDFRDLLSLWYHNMLHFCSSVLEGLLKFLWPYSSDSESSFKVGNIDSMLDPSSSGNL